MKLNCDLGEGFGQFKNDADEKIMPHIQMANIACGFHAGDPLIMTKTVAFAKQNNVTIGAHPSYPDLAGFGRRSMKIPADELIALIVYQVGALQATCDCQNVALTYVKPHGALYNDMMADLTIFDAVCQAMSNLNQYRSEKLTLMIQAMPDAAPFQKIADAMQIPLWFEAFADRNYKSDGKLVPRSQENAVIHSEKEALERCQHLLSHQEIISVEGTKLSMQVDTLCVHGDTPEALTFVRSLNKLLQHSSLQRSSVNDKREH